MNWLPIIIQCRELDLNYLEDSFDNTLKRIMVKVEPDKNVADKLYSLFQTRLQNGQLLLMLDGLDEIGEPLARQTLCQFINYLATTYPEVPIVITSSITSYHHIGFNLDHSFVPYTLASLTQKNKDTFIANWSKIAKSPERKNTLYLEMNSALQNKKIERLTDTPLLLVTMMLVLQKFGKLPINRADLYFNAFQALLNWRSESGEPLDAREVIPQLEYLAYAMCDHDVQQLRQDEIIDLLQRMRREFPNVYASRNHSPEEFLNIILQSSTIMVKLGDSYQLQKPMPVCGFNHIIYQEYFAARALVYGRFPGRKQEQSLAEHVGQLAGRKVQIYRLME